MANSLTNTNQANGKVKFSLAIQAPSIQNMIYSTLSDKKVAQSYIANICSVVAQNPSLQDCDVGTIITAGLTAHTLHLPLQQSLGFAYVLPYKDGKTGKVKAQFQIGWRGIVQLMMRSQLIKRVHTIEIRKGECVKYDPIKNIFEFKCIEDEEVREKTEVVGYYAYFETIYGFVQELYWTKKKMELHAKKYSEGYKRDLERGTSYTFWTKAFDEMAKKTMLKQISKFAPMSTELQEAIQKDQAVINEKGEIDYVDSAETFDNETGEIVENPKDDVKPTKKVVEDAKEEVASQDDGLLGELNQQ